MNTRWFLSMILYDGPVATKFINICQVFACALNTCMHVFIASDVYDYGKKLHYHKKFILKNTFWRVPTFTYSNLGI